MTNAGPIPPLRPLGVSTFALIRTTPLSDVFRGQLTGRLHPAALVAASDLPPPIQSLIIQVLRRSRLWRTERLDVARELIGHFTDGLRAGAAPDALVRSFGSPAAAARLIRRAKKRSRPLLWRTAVRAVQGTALVTLLIALTYGLLAWRFFIGSPSIRHNYIAEFNAPAVAVPPGQRAWPMYRAALIKIGPEPSFKFESPDGSQAGMWQQLDPDSPGFAEVDAWLNGLGPALEMVRTAAGLERLGYVTSSRTDWELAEARAGKPIDHAPDSDVEDTSMLGVLLPHLGEFRRLVRILDADIRHAAQAGDGARILADLRAMIGIARHAVQPRILISQMVQMAILHLAADDATLVLTDHPELLSEQQWVTLAHELGALGGPGGAVFRLDLSVERDFFEDILQRMFTDDGAGDGRLTPQGLRLLHGIQSGAIFGLATTDEDYLRNLVAPVVGQLVAGRRELRRLHQEYIAAAAAEDAIPLWLRANPSAIEKFEQELSASALSRARYLPIIALFGAYDRASGSLHVTGSRMQALTAAIAMEVHRRRTGHYPGSLGELAPGLLPEVPADPFDGRPLRYLPPDKSPAWAAGKPVLYSIGNDRVDGRAAEASPQNNVYCFSWIPPSPADGKPPARPAPLPTRGDWIAFPAIHAPPPVLPAPPAAPPAEAPGQPAS